jgi:hypothetical protein
MVAAHVQNILETLARNVSKGYTNRENYKEVIKDLLGTIYCVNIFIDDNKFYTFDSKGTYILLETTIISSSSADDTIIVDAIMDKKLVQLMFN